MPENQISDGKIRKYLKNLGVAINQLVFLIEKNFQDSYKDNQSKSEILLMKKKNIFLDFCFRKIFRRIAILRNKIANRAKIFGYM